MAFDMVVTGGRLVMPFIGVIRSRHRYRDAASRRITEASARRRTRRDRRTGQDRLPAVSTRTITSASTRLDRGHGIGDDVALVGGVTSVISYSAREATTSTSRPYREISRKCWRRAKATRGRLRISPRADDAEHVREIPWLVPRWACVFKYSCSTKG